MLHLCNSSANPVGVQTLDVSALLVWTDDCLDNRSLLRCVPLPTGLRNYTCPKCCGCRLVGAIITETADSLDPNILCEECGYWWD
jgi:hypothetical protein